MHIFFMSNLNLKYLLVWSLLFFGIFSAVTIDSDVKTVSVKTDSAISRSSADIKSISASAVISCTKFTNGSCTSFTCSDGTSYDTCVLCKSPSKINQTLRKIPTIVSSTISSEKSKVRGNLVFNESAFVNKTLEIKPSKPTDFFANLLSWLGGQKTNSTKETPSACKTEVKDDCEFRYCPIKEKEELVHVTCPSIGYGIQWWTLNGACEYKAVGYDKWNRAQCKVTCEKPFSFFGNGESDLCPTWMKIPDWKSNNSENTTDYFSPFAE